MCNQCNKNKERSGFDPHIAFKKLVKKQQDLTAILVKMNEEPDTAKSRSTLKATLREEISRIIGGVPTQAGEFPGCCLIGKRNRDGSLEWFCTGILVHPRLVLTAAHCIARFPVSYVVAVNTNDWKNISPGNILNVRKSIVNEKYKPEPGHYDIAALVLQEPSTVTPVPPATTQEIVAADKLILVGFGNDDINSSQGFGTQRKVTVDMVSIREDPNEDMGIAESQYGFESDLEFVAGGNGFDTCNGDSGGPVFIRTGNQLRVAGLTSRATDNSVYPCGDGGVYTRLDAHDNFISSILQTL